MASCFTLLNTQYFNDIISQINNVEDAVSLQNLVNTVYADISLLESTMTGQLDLLAPIGALLTPPTNPAAVITWIENLITGVLTPMYKPYLTQVAQLAALPAEIAAMTAAIESVAESKFPTITITIPSINPKFCTI